jgi:hypothetical protein
MFERMTDLVWAAHELGARVRAHLCMLFTKAWRFADLGSHHCI